MRRRQHMPALRHHRLHDNHTDGNAEVDKVGTRRQGRERRRRLPLHASHRHTSPALVRHSNKETFGLPFRQNKTALPVRRAKKRVESSDGYPEPSIDITRSRCSQSDAIFCHATANASRNHPFSRTPAYTRRTELPWPASDRHSDANMQHHTNRKPGMSANSS